MGQHPRAGRHPLTSWKYASKPNLLKTDLPNGTGKAIEKRILVAQAFYAFGAALCIFDPLDSIGFIVLVQLNFALALPSQRRPKNPCLRSSIMSEQAEWSYMKEVWVSSDPARML